MEKQMASPSLTDDSMRGRRRNRDLENEDGDDQDAGDTSATGGSKKRRRSRKASEKKFLCPHDDCGRSYSRAEHLYRHQLNRKCCSNVSSYDACCLESTICVAGFMCICVKKHGDVSTCLGRALIMSPVSLNTSQCL
jgi:hypothetical protein